jgi:SAM-dependent methyltransferase
LNETRVGRDYDRWIRGRSLSSQIYAFYASVPGAVLVNTPAFRLHTELQLRPEHRLLDIGCGRGSLLRVIASRVPFHTPPVGIDLAGAMLDLGRRDEARSKSEIALVQGSATALPFPDERFDVIICGYVVKHLTDSSLLRFFVELRRVLSPGGIAVLWEFGPTTSKRLNAFHERLLTLGISDCHLRGYTPLSAFALGTGFEWVGNANLRPFLFPPIPRVSLILGKAPPDWIND